MRRLNFLNRLGSLGAVTTVGSILTPVVVNRFVPYPFMMMFVVTRRCNGRCQMCNIWKEENSPILSLEQIKHIFSRNDFSFLRSLTLTGGEPTLRSDLPQLFEIIQGYAPNLEHVQLATNGLTPRRITEHVTRMLQVLDADDNRIHHFNVQVSLDGIGEVHDTIRGVPGAFQQVQATLAQLRTLQSRFPQLHLRLSCVLMPDNISHAESIHNFAKQQNLQIHYNPVVLSGEYYSNLQTVDDLVFSHTDHDAARQFFERLGKEDETSLRFFYQDMAQVVQGKHRSRRCMMGFYGFALEHDGSVYPCINCERTSLGSLLTDSFEDVWFGPQASGVRRQLHTLCCPTCTSVCYPLSVNALETIETRWRRWRQRVKS